MATYIKANLSGNHSLKEHLNWCCDDVLLDKMMVRLYCVSVDEIKVNDQERP